MTEAKQVAEVRIGQVYASRDKRELDRRLRVYRITHGTRYSGEERKHVTDFANPEYAWCTTGVEQDGEIRWNDNKALDTRIYVKRLLSKSFRLVSES
jgi:hypothetical protein